jgi:TrmH family RNA methyltransferase
MTIISSQNGKIKQLRALRQHKHRAASGLMLVEGIRPVGEAVAAGVALESLYYAPERLRSPYAWQLVRAVQARGVPVYPLTGDLFETVADKDNPQGLLAVACCPQRTLEQFSAANLRWAVALVAPQDPGNVGTILRTVDAVRAEGLLLLDAQSDPYHPLVVRSSMGALFWVPVISAPFAAFSAWAREQGYHIYGTSAHGGVRYQQVARYERPAILLMGNEREGLSKAQMACCEHLISLPMRGHSTSLNLAVATGIMLYEMLEKMG